MNNTAKTSTACTRLRSRSRSVFLILLLVWTVLSSSRLVQATDQVVQLRKLGLDDAAVVEALQEGGAEAVLGRRIADRAYSYAGRAQGYFDCSLFVQTVLAEEGLTGGRSAPDYASFGRAVDVDLWDIDRDKLMPGDILGYDTLNWGSTCHVGIYLGDGQAIHVNTVEGYMEVCDLRLRANFPITFVRRAVMD